MSPSLAGVLLLIREYGITAIIMTGTDETICKYIWLTVTIINHSEGTETPRLIGHHLFEPTYRTHAVLECAAPRKLP